MPKIIENLQEKLTMEARLQLLDAGYSAMTIRSVAAACQVGVGTVYHYFPSKDALVASVLLADWLLFMEEIAGHSAEGLESVLRAAYEGLTRFQEQYTALFHDEEAENHFPRAAGKYHPMLRSQLAAPIRPFCSDDYTADFIAEALLTWSLAGTPFCQLYGIIRKIV